MQVVHYNRLKKYCDRETEEDVSVTDEVKIAGESCAQGCDSSGESDIEEDVMEDEVERPPLHFHEDVLRDNSTGAGPEGSAVDSEALCGESVNTGKESREDLLREGPATDVEGDPVTESAHEVGVDGNNPRVLQDESVTLPRRSTRERRRPDRFTPS